MDIQELRRLRPELERYVKKFDDCIKTRPSKEHLRTYINGQLSPLESKSIEPIALEARVPPRSLQEFLSIHRWDEEAVARRHRELVMQYHSDPNAIGIIDETSFAKKGHKTAGVQRQYCGSTGKIDNCVVSVHLGYAAQDFHTLIDGDLYLPEESWAEDFGRRREARIPDGVVYRPKWKIALDIINRSIADGVRMSWLTADELYGRVRQFRETVASLGITYVVEVPASITGWTRLPKVEPAGTVTESGRKLKKPRLSSEAEEPRPVSKLWKRGGPSWQAYKIKDTDKGPVVWEVRESRFFCNDDGIPGGEERLIIAREVLTGEVKYFLSCAGAEVPLKILLYVAFSRWRIERLFEDGKGEVGFDHFEVRNYRSLMRHLILTMLSLYFLCEQTDRLREKKSELVPSPGEGRGGGTTRSGDVTARAYSPSRKSYGDNSALARKERESCLLS